MEKDVAAVLVDIDDCILPTSGKTFPDFFIGLKELAHCVRMANNGFFPKIAWCSGRDRNYIEAISFVLGLPNWWSIIESGIALFNPTTKALVINDALSPEVKSAFELIRKKRLPEILNFIPEIFEYPGNIINVALERRNGVDVPIENYYALIKDALADLLTGGLVNVHHSRIAVDISPAGIDKGSGVDFLCRKTGMNPKNLLGIGDSKGDFPMLNAVGFVGCPKNASDECKKLVTKKGGYVSPFDYAYGVYDIIRHFVPEFVPEAGLETI